MSEPLSATEIEDVVSSVRRLVSAEERPRVLSRDLNQEKLILTPALRVVSDAPAPPPLILTPAVEPEPAPPEPAEPDAVLVEAEWEDELWTPAEPLLAEIALGAEEAEVLPAGQEAVPELPEAEVVSGGEVLTAWPEGAGDWTDEPLATGGSAPESVAPQDTAPAKDLDVAGILTAAMVAEEPFHILDQDELHALVRNMVREELQGKLGERITRNVRKLVRAEINRALAARSLD